MTATLPVVRWWGRAHPAARAGIVIVAAIVVVNLILATLASLTGGPSGPGSSSYATSGDGLAAYSELLQRSGHPVAQLRVPPDRTALDPRTTLVIVDAPFLTSSEQRAVRDFVVAGGRLVAGGAERAPWIERLIEGPVEWSPESSDGATSLAPVPETGSVGTVTTAGEGAWSSPGNALPVLGDSSSALVLARVLGSGRMDLLADASFMQNRLLDRADNATLAVNLAGAPGRPVVFLETVHGYGSGTGLGALPWRWRWALAGAGIAAIVWLIARGRRLGPPEAPARALPPPRSAYVQSLALSLGRARSGSGAGKLLAGAALQRVLRRTGLPRDAREDDVKIAARRIGLSDEDVEVLRAADPDPVAAGRALAKASKGVE